MKSASLLSDDAIGDQCSHGDRSLSDHEGEDGGESEGESDNELPRLGLEPSPLQTLGQEHYNPSMYPSEVSPVVGYKRQDLPRLVEGQWTDPDYLHDGKVVLP